MTSNIEGARGIKRVMWEEGGVVVGVVGFAASKRYITRIKVKVKDKNEDLF